MGNYGSLQAIGEQAERHHEERHHWHLEAMSINEKVTEKHRKGWKIVVTALFLRPVIEILILITLLVKL